MDEKQLADWLRHQGQPHPENEIQKEHAEVFRLARLGLWAETVGVEALRYYSLIHRGVEDLEIVSGVPAREALAKLPKAD